MQPDSNQSACFYGTAKTHNFENLEDITVANLKFRSIINQTVTFTYNSEKVISDYDLYFKTNISSMARKNFQACYLQFQLYKMMEEMYHIMLSHYLQIFR